jgi:hypothetical protein
MLSNPVLDVVFVVSITSFFKKQLKLTGWLALLCAFIVTLFISLTPIIAAAYPPIAPWLTDVVTVVVLFLTAAGSYDLVMDVRTQTTKPSPGL